MRKEQRIVGGKKGRKTRSKEEGGVRRKDGEERRSRK